ncbi:MAG TPA: hypothetical protein VJP85_11225 [Candidatus Baltobacteraceae bacterium]|nr:hypothetical protein [Candidatus Baltobacteraceae bacterium]
MSRFAHLAAFLALVAALCIRVQAAAWPGSTGANLDLHRMFDPQAESLLAGLFTPHRDTAFSPISIALFNEPSPVSIQIAPALPTMPAGEITASAVTLHAYTPAATLPAPPLGEPSVAAAPAVARPQLVQPHLRVVASAPDVHFGTYIAYAPAVQSLKEDVNVPVRIGGVHFSGLVSGAQQQSSHADAVRAMQLCGTTDEAAACPYLHDERTQNFAAGTNFNVRAGNTQVNLQLSGSVGRITNGDAAMYQYVPLDPDPQLDAVRAGSPEDTSLLYYPGLTDMVRHGMNARLAVPISRALTVGLQYDSAHYQGNYGTIFAPGLDARKDTYLGNVTYQLPNSSSLLTLSARQYRYQDSLTPFNLTETRADLSFTVKF